MPIHGEKLQDRARDAALALPGVSPGRPFTDQLDVCKVAGKVFLIVTDDPDERIVTLKEEPEYGRLLQHEHPSITAALPTKLSLPGTWRSSHPEVERPGRHASR
ncbi:MmcQ/YjbR family DNA-binding protein [Streptomyces sp. NBC_01724]|uniref:MmcQ/YjbR family DNA-binding protein n=1 Tax=unclassified Streptomyces TaxID=2593676 RepID=UPI002E31689B|nr:MmcQ/YjbR family DNA-binding protein [Streptomyces sp. NBC_01724]WTE56242.1 MmcQ/YjbR family DNA-binding protein [Streptomyces sp. NBC_01620]WTE64316.1 MmcQ/YjbR family DNA-binding protein [Streptomyces sp. NBC_01617]WTI91601.1 MmcQ/YjbR family DNA-binding protein [Streptomyces sp. NBC_00724]